MINIPLNLIVYSYHVSLQMHPVKMHGWKHLNCVLGFCQLKPVYTGKWQRLVLLAKMSTLVEGMCIFPVSSTPHDIQHVTGIAANCGNYPTWFPYSRKVPALTHGVTDQLVFFLCH